MLCPTCVNERLIMSEKKGVEIDYCPKCRGVWLDRGEIDKIIERSVAELTQPMQQPNYPGNASAIGPEKHSNNYGHQKHYKKKSIWNELFDFD